MATPEPLKANDDRTPTVDDVVARYARAPASVPWTAVDIETMMIAAGAIIANPGGLDKIDDRRLALLSNRLSALAKTLRPARKRQRVENKKVKKKEKRKKARVQRRLMRDRTIMRRRHNDPACLQDKAPNRSGIIGELDVSTRCYVCKERYTSVHWFYDRLCVCCGNRNHDKRKQTADLTHNVALVTGGRVKIGFQVGLLLLRAGCRVIVTTRFPDDAKKRYAREADFASWAGELEVHGLNLRDTKRVESFCDLLLGTHERLDFIINNAAQTLARPRDYYGSLLAHETAEYVPQEKSADVDDITNSWRLRLDAVTSDELREVFLVNAVAPFVINARLKQLLLRTPSMNKQIINVSAVEGQFVRRGKTSRHPHTNMAKAALNMMTRTCAQDYIQSGIRMNSVDTGWITNEHPAKVCQFMKDAHDFQPPLDAVDGAARILDPIFTAVREDGFVWGEFLKDFLPTHW